MALLGKPSAVVYASEGSCCERAGPKLQKSRIVSRIKLLSKAFGQVGVFSDRYGELLARFQDQIIFSFVVAKDFRHIDRIGLMNPDKSILRKPGFQLANGFGNQQLAIVFHHQGGVISVSFEVNDFVKFHKFDTVKSGKSNDVKPIELDVQTL